MRRAATRGTSVGKLARMLLLLLLLLKRAGRQATRPINRRRPPTNQHLVAV